MAEVVKNKFVSARTKLLRRTSGLSEPSSTTSTSPETEIPHSYPNSRRKPSFPGLHRSSTRQRSDGSQQSPITPARETSVDPETRAEQVPIAHSIPQRPPTLTIQEPSSPELKESQILANAQRLSSNNQLESTEHPDPQPQPPSAPSSRAGSTRPPLTRNSTQGSYTGIPSLINKSTPTRPSTGDSDLQDKYVDAAQTHLHRPPASTSSLQNCRMSSPPRPWRKVWVRRLNASATLVQFAEEDLVDDVRDTILQKYRNSLGKSFDSPDVTLRVQPRQRSTNPEHERTLGPEESIQRVLDAYYPGGQEVTEALLIDVPQRRTPRPSPRIVAPRGVDHYEDMRPSEDDGGYFPPMPAVANSTGQLTPQERRPKMAAHPHSIAILETGQAPCLPSPRENRRPRSHRQHTSSPTIVGSTGSGGSVPPGGYPSAPYQHTHTPKQARNRRDSNDRLKGPAHAPIPPPLPSSPSLEAAQIPLGTTGHKVATPPAALPASATSPRLSGSSSKPKRIRKSAATNHHENPGMQGLESATSVPPINVLIVEDNIINLRLMEQFVNKLKVRWDTAMNGRDAVARWRAGGFHLVLMDLQMPIMNGLDATREIRRLERVNGVGVFAKSDDDGITDGSTETDRGNGVTNGNGVTLARRASKETADEDKLSKGGNFKSPVIIVALTASSLQSDRREALAAGCNDFLTKPVDLGKFERKVMEWGCMQALIDFNGWRQWKELGERKAAEDKKKAAGETPEQRERREKREAKRMAMVKKMGQA